MRLKVKNIGDDLTLDEYNAYNYLLYHMSCWNEQILLNTYTSYAGKYAKYLFLEHENILPEKDDTFTVITEFSETNNSIQIQLSDINNLLTQLHIGYSATLYVKQPEPAETITITDENNETITETFARHPSDHLDLNDLLQEESQKAPDLSDYTAITVQAQYNKDKQILTIPVYEQNTLILPVNTVIHRQVDINMDLNNKPYIDVNNGKANEINEILLDNVEELEKIIATPVTQKIIIRLDSNIEYTLKKTLIIQNNQNVEIRGGTNKKATINGINSYRSIIIKPGGQLTLKNINIINNNATKTTYETGKGGAILVEAKTYKGQTKFGVLECNSCTFSNNTATQGGVIYSYHAGIYVNNCTFSNNTATRGGTIYYYSKDIILTFKDIYTTVGETIKPSVIVKDYLGNSINSGTIQFILSSSTNNITANIVNGVATFDYTIPTTFKDQQLTITAVYSGSSEYDSDVAKCTVYVKQKETYTATLNIPTTIYRGDQLTAIATVTNNNKEQTNIPLGHFTYNGTTVATTKVNNKYQMKLTIPTNAPDTVTIKFQLDNEKCETTKTIKVLNKITTKTVNKIYGLFVNQTVNSSNECTITATDVDNWIKAGITDVYVRMIQYDKQVRRATLEKIAKLCQDKNIHVHAVLNVFYDIDKKGTKSSPRWQTSTSTARTTRIEYIKNEITKITKNMNIDGICLDYFRYPGNQTGAPDKDKFHPVITNAMKTIYQYIKNIDKNYIVSVCTMPEEAGTSTYYGQNYKELSEYTDYMHIMAYRGNYRGTLTDNTNEWVKKVVTYAQNQAGKDKIVCTLQTYTNDSDVEKVGINKCKRTKNNLDTTIKQIASNDSRGVTLFRYVKDTNPICSDTSEYPINYTEL